MELVLWLLIVAVVLIVAVGLFALVRSRQRSGTVLASRRVSRNGGGS